MAADWAPLITALVVVLVILVIVMQLRARQQHRRHPTGWRWNPDWARRGSLPPLRNGMVTGRREHLAAPSRVCMQCAPCTNGTCSPVDGSCVCNPGWGGADCSTPINCCSGDPSTACADGSACDPKSCTCSCAGPGCSKCNAQGACIACEPTYWLKDGACVSCAQNCVNYPTGDGTSVNVCNAKTGACASVDPNCAAPNADGSCKTCVTDYYPAPWTAT